MDISCCLSPKRKLDFYFQMYDINGKGTIEEEEMKEVLEAICEMNGENPKKAADLTKKIFKKMDKDKNGSITRDSFLKACLKDKWVFDSLANEK